MEDAHKLLKIPNSECPNISIRLPRQKWPESWPSVEDPVVLFQKDRHENFLAVLLCENQFERLLKYGWEKVSN